MHPLGGGHLWSTGLLGLAAHLREQVIVAKPAADGIGDLRGVSAERSESAFCDEGDVSGLFGSRGAQTYEGIRRQEGAN